MRSLLFLLALTAPALAGAPPAGLGDGTPDKFEVLDASIAKGFAVIKLVEHDEDLEEEGSPGSVDCGYAGMTATPRSGVTLALWDLGAGRLGETFPVYAKVSDPAACTSHEESQRVLAAAKAAATAKGLDVARKPALVAPGAGKSFTLDLGGRKVQVTVEAGTRDVEDDGSMRVSYARLLVGGAVIHEVEESYLAMGAALVGLSFPHAYVEGDQVVFVLKRTASDMRSPETTSWALTPPLRPGG